MRILVLAFSGQPFLDQAEWTEIADIPVGLLPAGLTLIAPWTIRLPVRLAIRLAVRLIPPTVRPPCRLAVRAIVRIVGVRAVVRVLVRFALWLAVLRMLILSVLRSRRTLAEDIGRHDCCHTHHTAVGPVDPPDSAGSAGSGWAGPSGLHWSSFGLLIVTP